MPSVPEPREIPPQPATSGRRLDSWKEIAAYFQRNERTVRRWEQTEGLPVHRHVHDKRGSVYANTAELDAWRTSRGAGLEKQAPEEARRRDRRLVLGAILVGILVATGVTTWRIAGMGRTTTGLIQIRPLTSYPGSERYPSFSPDGNHVAFSWDGARQDNVDIYIKTIGEETPRRLTIDPAEELSPAWSPDGSWIAFLRILPAGRAAVCLVPTMGGPERTLAEIRSPPKLAEFGSHIAWSPNGEWLVVPDKDLPQEPFSLVRIALVNGEKRKLTSPRVQHGDIAAAVSPTGRAVAFIRRSSFSSSELYLAPISEDGAPQQPERQVTSFGRRTTSPAWTPDGKALLFVSGDPGSEAIVWRMDGSGTGRPWPVGSLGDHAALLAASRQHRLVFTRYIQDANIWRIRSRKPEGNGPPWEKEPLLSSTRRESDALYSPDGEQISFESSRSGSRELWKSERAGSNAVQLTSVGGPGVCCSRWSSDGRLLIFVSWREGLAHLYLINASGGPPRPFTNGPYNHNTPSWSRDGQWIYFQSDRNGQFQVWKMPANGGQAIQVTRSGGRLALESMDGRYLYFTSGGTLPSDSASLWRTSGPGGEEAQIMDGLAGYNSFAVTAEGIYFLSLRGPSGARGSIEFLDFNTGKTRTIAPIDRPFGGGISVLPGRGGVSEILYTQVDHEGSDLMLVEKFW